MSQSNFSESDLMPRPAHVVRASKFDQDVKKMYWHIGEVADKLGVSASAIRFYDESFSLSPKRGHSGNRLFTESDVKRLESIVKLSKHYKLEAVKLFVDAGVEFEAAVKLEEILAKI